jgi:hypothetical protein
MKQQNHSAAHVPGSTTRLSNPATSLYDTAATGFQGTPAQLIPGFLPFKTVICHSMYYVLYSTY